MEASDYLLDVLDIVLKLFLLKLHDRQLGLRVSIQHLHALLNGVLDVLRAFKHHPPLVDILGTQAILELFQDIVDVSALVDFLLDLL